MTSHRSLKYAEVVHHGACLGGSRSSKTPRLMLEAVGQSWGRIARSVTDMEVVMKEEAKDDRSEERCARTVPHCDTYVRGMSGV